MVNKFGTSVSDSLFGTPENDLIRGLGGKDIIKGAGGNDTLTGYGDVSGNAGRDRYYAVAVPFGDYVDFFGTTIKMGAGRDTVILNLGEGEKNWASGDWEPIELGSGDDTVIVTSPLPISPLHESDRPAIDLGSGNDRILVASLRGESLKIDAGLERVVIGGDSQEHQFFADMQKDVIEFDCAGTGTLEVYHFGENDVLKIYGQMYTLQDIRIRTDFESDATKTDLTIHLDDGGEIKIHKDWSGYLTALNLEVVDSPFSVTRDVLIGHDQKPTRVTFASGGDDTLTAKSAALFLGEGDDVGIGRYRDDHICGEGGNDLLKGGRGADKLYGGAEDDRIHGGPGNDIIRTGRGDDVARGGFGSDIIHVGGGADNVFGGAGADKFVFNSKSVFEAGDSSFSNLMLAKIEGGGGRDVYVLADTNGYISINDFDPEQDVLNIRRQLIDSYPSGADRYSKIESILSSASNSGEFGYTYIHINDAHVSLAGVSPDELSLDNFIW